MTHFYFFLQGLLGSLSQKRIGEALLKKEGIVLPSDIRLV
jgi:hypothetical protein